MKMRRGNDTSDFLIDVIKAGAIAIIGFVVFSGILQSRGC